MSSCGRLIAFAGRSNFNSLLSEVIGVSLVKYGNDFTDATFISLATWHTLIAGIAEMKALPLSIKRGFENTTPEVALETSNIGFSEQTTQPIPALKGYLDGSYCDYKTINALNGQSFKVVLHLKDGSQFATRNSSLAVKGFSATINTYFGLPLAENRQQSYPIWLNFESYDEFIDGYLSKPDYTLRDLLDYIPVGLDIKVTTLLTTTAVIKVINRATGAGVTGLTADDFTVLATNADDVDVSTVVDDGSGQYTITVVKDAAGTPVALASGEYATIQATDDDATYYTYSSGSLKLAVV